MKRVQEKKTTSNVVKGEGENQSEFVVGDLFFIVFFDIGVGVVLNRGERRNEDRQTHSTPCHHIVNQEILMLIEIRVVVDFIGFFVEVLILVLVLIDVVEVLVVEEVEIGCEQIDFQINREPELLRRQTVGR